MTFILDTHIFLRVLSEPDKLSTKQIAEIQTRANTVYLSSISIAEIMIKTSLGKLDINFDPIELAEKSGFDLLDYRAKDAVLLKDLPYHHKDPFDRMLITQSLTHNFPIMTVDSQFKKYSCKLI